MVPVVGAGKQAVFTMGSADLELQGQALVRQDADYYVDDEQPSHQVTLSVPYSVGKYEVTNTEFCSVMNWAIDHGKATIADKMLTAASSETVFAGLAADGGDGQAQVGIVVVAGRLEPAKGREKHPVASVTWYGAAAFADFLSEMSGLEPVYDMTTWQWDATRNGYRLPTEAEWEYAARGTTRNSYAWGFDISDRYVPVGDTAPVGSFAGNASPFGAYDMTGNVREWAWDWYGRTYYRTSPATDPTGPASGDDRPPYAVDTPTRVLRGCGWYATPESGYLRVSKRWSAAAADYQADAGFRIARTSR
jgi:formylglycine-generating enzyme required for sulfatase activity